MTHSLSSALRLYPEAIGLCKTMWHGSICQTGKTNEAFIKDAKILVLVNRGDLLPVEKKLTGFICALGTMKTLDLNEAADFLKLNPEVLRRKARAGQVPGRKAGKCWIFIKEHLADWVSGRYSEPRRGLQVIDELEQEDKKTCQSTSEKKRGGFSSPRLTDAEYNKLLGLN